MAIVVTHQAIRDANQTVTQPVAWRVAVDEEAEYRAISMEFATERDADRARAALESLGLVETNALRQAGKETVFRIMLETLAW